MATTAKQRPFPDNFLNLIPNFIGAERNNAEVLARANQIVADTTKAIWSREIELMRLETEQLVKMVQPVKTDGDFGKLVADYYDKWHEGSEKTIAEMREVSDLIRDCGWRLLDLYSDSLARQKEPTAPSE